MMSKGFLEGVDRAARVCELGWRRGDSWEQIQESLYEMLELYRNENKSPEEIAHEDSYWDDPLRGTNKC